MTDHRAVLAKKRLAARVAGTERVRGGFSGVEKPPRVLLAAGTTGFITLSRQPPGFALRRLGQRLEAHRVRDRCTDLGCGCR